MNKKSINREAVFYPEFRADLEYWVKTERKVALQIFKLIEAIMREPFTSIGQPEPLKYLEPNTWSRRITKEHRLVYWVSHDRIDFLQARYIWLPVNGPKNFIRSIKSLSRLQTD